MSLFQRGVMMSSNDNNNNDDMELPPSGSFFNEIPPPKEENANYSSSNNLNNINDMDEIGIISSADNAYSNLSLPNLPLLGQEDGTDMFKRIIQNTKLSSSSSGGGFAPTTSTTGQTISSIIKDSNNGRNFIGIGKRLNDIRNPEYDENGYTLYADETTGIKRRVFEALVSYPSVFKIKIIGRDEIDESNFAPEMVNLVAKCCNVNSSTVYHTERKSGKWTSVTIHAPVQDADMLYALYASVDKDPRVKFKF
jgi:putative lipoic acid-binding regulatory protein